MYTHTCISNVLFIYIYIYIYICMCVQAAEGGAEQPLILALFAALPRALPGRQIDTDTDTDTDTDIYIYIYVHRERERCR